MWYEYTPTPTPPHTYTPTPPLTHIYNTFTPTHHGLYHERPFTPHFGHKLINIQVVFLLQSLHHCIDGDECTRTTNTSTCRENSLQKMYYKVILYHCSLHNMIVVTFIDNPLHVLTTSSIGALLTFHLKVRCVTVTNSVLSKETNPLNQTTLGLEFY